MSDRDEVEFEVLDDSRPAASPRAPTRARRRDLRGAGWALMGCVLIVAGIVIGPRVGPVVVDPGAGVGLLRLDLAAEPTTVWEVPTGFNQPRDVALLDDTLLAVTGTVRAFDLETGQTRWSSHGSTGRCSIHTRVVCVAEPGTPVARLAVLDVATGEPTPLLELPGALLAADIDGSDVAAIVATGPDGDPGYRVVRLDATGAPVWTSPFPSEVIGGAGEAALSLDVSADVLVVQGLGSVLVDLTTGELDPLGGDATATPFGDLATRENDDGLLTMTLTDEQGVVLADDLTAFPDDAPRSTVELQLDTAGLTVVRGSEELWRDDRQFLAVSRVRGVITAISYGSETVALVGLDQATGAQLWEQAYSWPLAAAGGTLLTGGPLGLTAIDVRTGEPHWALGDAGGRVIAVVGDDLVVATSGGLLRLSFPRW